MRKKKEEEEEEEEGEEERDGKFGGRWEESDQRLGLRRQSRSHDFWPVSAEACRGELAGWSGMRGQKENGTDDRQDAPRDSWQRRNR